MLALSRGLAAPPRCRGHGAGQRLLREGLGLRTILVQTPNPNPEPISPRLKMNMISLPSEEALWQACRVQGYSIIAMVCLAVSCKANFSHLCSQVERSNVVAKKTKMTIKKAGAGSSTDPVQAPAPKECPVHPYSQGPHQNCEACMAMYEYKEQQAPSCIHYAKLG
jgi:hypothetical protein